MHIVLEKEIDNAFKATSICHHLKTIHDFYKMKDISSLSDNELEFSNRFAACMAKGAKMINDNINVQDLKGYYAVRNFIDSEHISPEELDYCVIGNKALEQMYDDSPINGLEDVDFHETSFLGYIPRFTKIEMTDSNIDVYFDDKTHISMDIKSNSSDPRDDMLYILLTKALGPINLQMLMEFLNSLAETKIENKINKKRVVKSRLESDTTDASE